jgi:hypothetical protein
MRIKGKIDRKSSSRVTGPQRGVVAREQKYYSSKGQEGE